MSFSFLLLLYVVAFIWLTYHSPKVSLALLVALAPSYLIRFPVGGIPTTLFEVTLWVVVIVWFVRQSRLIDSWRLPNPRVAFSPANPFSPYILPLLLWLVVATAAAVISPDIESALGIWKAYFIEPVLLFSLLVVTFAETPERRWVAYALGVAVVAVAAMAWLQKLTGLWIPEPYISNLPLKVTSFYPYPNAVGLFVGPIAALYGTWLIARPRISVLELSWRFLVFVLAVGAIAFSMTKGAWVGVVVGLLIGAVFAAGRGRRLFVIVMLGAAMLAVLFEPTARQTALRYSALHTPSGEMRRVVWQETFAYLRDHPLSGAGLGGYQTALVPYHEEWRPDVSPYKLEIFLYPHNIFLNAWTELGLAGLIVFIWLLGVFTVTAWRRRGHALSVASLAAMAALVVHGLVDVPYFKNDLAVLFWVLMALPLLEGRRVHILHVGEESYRLLQSGARRVEPRLNDVRHSRITAGDLVVCYPHEGSYECVRLEVIRVTQQPTFAGLLALHHPAELGFEHETQGLASLRQQFSEDDEAEFGVVGIHVRPA